MNVRPARDDEYLTVRRILDAAVLRYGDLDRRTVLVAVENGPESAVGGSRSDEDDGDDGDDGDPVDEACEGADGDRVIGALVLDGAEIEAVAVRRRRRGQAIGTALVEAAAERRNRLEAEFDVHVSPFYESLGFDVECVREKRCRGTLDAGDS